MGVKRREIEWEISAEGCHICTSHKARDKDGYSLITFDCKQYRLHRVMYERHKGKIPEGMVVRHKCDNPMCINPEHLEVGTHQDNVMDKFKRGRNKDIRGENNNMSKFTEEDVLFIRNSSDKGIDLAKKYNVAPTTISKIRKGKRWKHI